MCGFAGHVGESPPDAVAAATELLRHRGPDGTRVVRAAPWALLGQARLRVIDLSEAADQPVSNEDGSVWVVLNGEIYDFAELRVDEGYIGAVMTEPADQG